MAGSERPQHRFAVTRLIDGQLSTNLGLREAKQLAKLFIALMGSADAPCAYLKCKAASGAEAGRFGLGRRPSTDGWRWQ